MVSNSGLEWLPCENCGTLVEAGDFCDRCRGEDKKTQTDTDTKEDSPDISDDRN